MHSITEPSCTFVQISPTLHANTIHGGDTVASDVWSLRSALSARCAQADKKTLAVWLRHATQTIPLCKHATHSPILPILPMQFADSDSSMWLLRACFCTVFAECSCSRLVSRFCLAGYSRTVVFVSVTSTQFIEPPSSRVAGAPVIYPISASESPEYTGVQNLAEIGRQYVPSPSPSFQHLLTLREIISSSCTFSRPRTISRPASPRACRKTR